MNESRGNGLGHFSRNKTQNQYLPSDDASSCFVVFVYIQCSLRENLVLLTLCSLCALCRYAIQPRKDVLRVLVGAG